MKALAPLISAALFLSRLSISSGASAASSTNLYKTLGVARDASQSEIKKAYRKAALKNHPDKVPEAERSKAEQRFKEIAKAYECLSDDDKRKQYDRYGERSLEPNFSPGMFDGAAAGGGNPFGGHGGAGGTQTFHFGPGSGGGGGGFPGGMFGGMPQGGNSGAFAEVNLEDLIRQMMGGGVKADPRGSQGFGGFPSGGQSSSGFGNPFGAAAGQFNQQAPRRHREVTKPIYCTLEDICKGCTKKMKVSYPQSGDRVYEVKLKKGLKAGTKVRYPATRSTNEMGMEVEYPPITFVVKEKKHPYLERDGNDLVWRCRLSPRQAERGARLKLPLPDGTSLEVVSGAGTESGGTRRIPGRGLPSKSGVRGDVVIQFEIVDDR